MSRKPQSKTSAKPAKTRSSRTPKSASTKRKPTPVVRDAKARKKTSTKSTRRTTKTMREPSYRLRRLRRRLPWRSLLVLAFVSGLVGGGHWLWTSGHVEATYDEAVEKAYAFSIDAGFAVTKIEIFGHVQSDEIGIIEALETGHGAAILRFDPLAAQARIESLPWIETAIVERQLPGLIVVRVEEQRPAALWQKEGSWAVIDESGSVIEGAIPASFSDLPKVVGPGAEDHVGEILDLAKRQPDLAREIYAAIRVGNRRWNIRLHSGIDVRLPENDPITAWERLARLESVADLLSRDVSVIDLRRDDRLLLRLAPDAEIRQPEEPGQET